MARWKQRAAWRTQLLGYTCIPKKTITGLSLSLLLLLGLSCSPFSHVACVSYLSSFLNYTSRELGWMFHPTISAQPPLTPASTDRESESPTLASLAGQETNLDVDKAINRLAGQETNLDMDKAINRLAGQETNLDVDKAINRSAEGQDLVDGFIPLPHAWDSSKTASYQCWSRKERELFRLTPEFGPSVELIGALARYEELHYNCTHKVNWTEAFDGTPPPANRKDGQLCQYIVWSIHHAISVGLGNRIMSLIGAFFYGLLTDRVLLIDTYAWDEMQDLFCDPFRYSSWWTPLSPKQHLDLSVKPNALEYARRITSEQHVDKRYARYVYGMNEFFCGHTQLALESATWLYYSTYLYDVPAVVSNPVFRKKAKHLFPDNEIATHLTRFLLLPANSVWAKIKIAAEARLSPTHTVVGMQIRDFGAYNPKFSTRARICLEQFGVLPSPIPDAEPPPEASWPMPDRQLAPGNVTSLLVTALHEQYYLDMKEVYEGRLRGDGTIVSVVMESHGEKEDHGLQQIQQALVEIWLLSFSHTLMISYMSTFGYVAAALSARRPIYLNIVQRPELNNTYKTNNKPICERATTVEPCMHRDPNYKCSTDPYGIGYGHGTVPEGYDAIRPCRDFSSGIVLTHDPKLEYTEAVDIDGLLRNITLYDK